MERIDRIQNHPLYVGNQQRINELEQDRIFCCHSVNHSLDVARILYILVLEQGLSYEKDIVYATALLHDIGRGMQYTENVSHHEAGAELAKEILKECDFREDEIAMIVAAIAGHHAGKSHGEDGAYMQEKPTVGENALLFMDLFYKADKLSRNCFACKAQEECYWAMEKRNLHIKY